MKGRPRCEAGAWWDTTGRKPVLKYVCETECAFQVVIEPDILLTVLCAEHAEDFALLANHKVKMEPWWEP
jgi:hypothetical protein